MKQAGIFQSKIKSFYSVQMLRRGKHTNALRRLDIFTEKSKGLKLKVDSAGKDWYARWGSTFVLKHMDAGMGSYFWKWTWLQLQLLSSEELGNFSYFSYHYKELTQDVT